MSNETMILLITAASIGFFHTLMGPDHYVPFIVMAKARKWSMPKTITVTALCGVGHIGSSVLLGFIGVALGLAVGKLEVFEGFRGNIAGWLLLAFGFAYFIWGIRQAIKNKPHTHAHFHENGIKHDHEHKHKDEHVHAHEKEKKNITPWILFTIFVFGPCEPLIPLLMYPASQHNMFSLILVTATFGIVTLSTMLGMVVLATKGISLIPTAKIERYAHAIAGFTIFLCGVAIQMGL
ncbi:MAG: sulfite exporter TauE/SafE family protein [Armatimonadota bacterium]